MEKETIKKVFKYLGNKFFSVVILGILLYIIIQITLIPKTDIDFNCFRLEQEIHGINLKLDMVEFNFVNNAKWSGDDFNLLIEGVKIDEKDNYGFEYTSSINCKFVNESIIVKKFQFTHIKCDYIPPKSNIKIRFLSQEIPNGINIFYWSKTTPRRVVELDCI